MNHPRNLHADVRRIWDASVDAVRAKSLVQRLVSIVKNSEGTPTQLQIGDQQWNLSPFKRIIVVGAGKAATAMAAGLVESLGSKQSDSNLPVVGWVNVPEGTLPDNEIPGIHVHPARPPGVNEPTKAGVVGTEEMMKLVGTASSTDLCIALISGGGSALMPLPIDGITLDDKLQVTRQLSSSGANIGELNTVRKHLSLVKGGGLRRACNAGRLITLVLSDVLGDPLDLIASGPTQIDPSTPGDALEVLYRFDPDRTLSDRIYDRLLKLSGAGEEKPRAIDADTIVIGNNFVAVDAADKEAKRLGYETTVSSAQQCEGSAESVGRELAEWIIQMLDQPNSDRANSDRANPNRGSVRVSGGEPTVNLVASEVRGRGGRNQQLVLAAYQHLQNAALTEDHWERLTLLSGGTDGEDGPTNAAGAFINASVHRSALDKKFNPSEYLASNDAYHFFHQCGGLLMTGPTGTNVCDVRVAIVM